MSRFACLSCTNKGGAGWKKCDEEIAVKSVAGRGYSSHSAWVKRRNDSLSWESIRDEMGKAVRSKTNW